MSDPKSTRPPGAPGTPAKPEQPACVSGKDAHTGSSPSGRVVHDERGNAVWAWVKETSRIAIDATSRLLKKLEAPELKVEDTSDHELRLMPDGKNCVGGGYDPYNQSTKPRKAKPTGT
jgi:hypothetical protein